MRLGMLLFMGGCVVLGYACSENAGPRELKAELTLIERHEAALKLFIDSSESVDWEDAEVAESVRALLRAYAAFANQHHGDSLAGAFLMRRADLLQGRGDFEEAVNQWLSVLEGYPQAHFAPEAIFRIGFTRETALRDTMGALKAYGQLVDIYPESMWTEQAQHSLKWLTFSEAQMIQALEEEK